ncbi:hypothetical protein HRbin17_00471 [bacterium HR17]|uniref:EcxA zinc-binding domain-containing protein n=1 Tax=Candidatus Fervidibacter japonicus TaxID=2035412 RepID=A0A2H5X9W0_9BACT|nr:hypothetical protein HRbin17_00471 [bacterium HR17]
MMRWMSLGGDRLPDEPPPDYVHAFLRQLVAHEVGHTLGLRHDFHGSSSLPPDALHHPAGRLRLRRFSIEPLHRWAIPAPQFPR